jgi:uncharacterized protein YqeY
MRDKITAAMKTAMLDREADRLATLRLINAAIKDRDIAMRGEGNAEGVNDEAILGILAKMVKQRQDSAQQYESAGRKDLACRERFEIKVIGEFLPKQLSEEEVRAAVQKAINSVGAESIRDMGRVMGVLKSNYAGQMDFGKAGGAVKQLLG